MEILTFYILVAIGVFLSSCSQILLKKSAQREHTSKIAEMLNGQVKEKISGKKYCRPINDYCRNYSILFVEI